jgi:hypothetical protein
MIKKVELQRKKIKFKKVELLKKSNEKSNYEYSERSQRSHQTFKALKRC